MKALTEKQLGHALFYAIKIQDFDHAEYLLTIDAPVNTSFFIDQEAIAYTTSNFRFMKDMMVGKAANVIKKYGVSHANSQQVLRILDAFIDRKCDLRCHCNPKNPHYCALSQAFRYTEMKTEDDLLVEQNLLILKLLYHGATYKNLTNEKGFKWNAIDILNSFIETKKEDVVELIKLNRHTKGCESRHVKCRTNRLIDQRKS